MKEHFYSTSLTWTGNTGSGTKGYHAYERDHIIQVPGKPQIEGSSDPSFMGDSSRYNPEELFLASLSACHMLWYLHLCAVKQITVLRYFDEAEGTLIEEDNGAGKFDLVTLHPVVTISRKIDTEKALSLHKEAHKMCFIANSCSVPIHHEPIIDVDSTRN